MGNLFKHASNVSKTAFLATLILYIIIIASFIPSIVFAGNVFAILIKIAAALVILVTILGMIYSFFIKGGQKFLFLLLHAASLFIVLFSISAFMIAKSADLT
ncbi:hypothetical protein P4678_04625 [Priestia megaterium]|uniref:hypothetical protein n=1 Tax=Priestia megaterium TaxID=1404 RepID=UPI002E225736|nr:hypothetical protein [Priestia megaterium]MED4289483.1 hypothetical protein [Priestia megaterium]MED4293919.1 hypothetical protein [Priestia megaterium]